MKKLKRISILLLLGACYGFNSCEIQDDRYLSQRTLRDYVKQAESINVNKISDTLFDTLEYDKIIAYDFHGSYEPHYSVIKNKKKMKFAPVVLSQKYLNQEQANFVTEFLVDDDNYGGSTAACFDPHLGIVFFKDSKIQCVVNICLGCNYLETTSVLKEAKNQNKSEDYGGNGFSKSGRQKIIELSAQLGFEYGEAELEWE